MNARLRLAAIFVFGLLALGLAVAGEALPALTGRVVDNAHVLKTATKESLVAKLADLEAKSTIQLVVATVPDLAGQEIEPYANELFRFWKLGRGEKNNGVLFLVAPKQHRMRIEVGYGLEGTLTDAISKIIIANAAAPRFKTGDFDGGVTRAVDDIITALTTDAGEWKPKYQAPTPVRASNDDPDAVIFAIIFIVFIAFMIWGLSRSGRRTGGAWIIPGGSFSSGSSSSSDWSSSSSSDSFSGGGGSSGGGGASGDW